MSKLASVERLAAHVGLRVTRDTAAGQWLVQRGPDTDANLQTLCTRPCHEDKTREDLGQTLKRPVGEDGWPL